MAWAAAAQPGGWRMPQAPSGDSFEMKEIHVASAGNDLYGEAYIPKAPGKHPAIILSHGYGGSHAGFYSLIPDLVAEGYVCYCYDFAGGGRGSKSTGKSTDMSIFTERVDLLNVLEAVRSWDCVDPDKEPGRVRVRHYGSAGAGQGPGDRADLSCPLHPGRCPRLVQGGDGHSRGDQFHGTEHRQGLL